MNSFQTATLDIRNRLNPSIMGFGAIIQPLLQFLYLMTCLTSNYNSTYFQEKIKHQKTGTAWNNEVRIITGWPHLCFDWADTQYFAPKTKKLTQYSRHLSPSYSSYIHCWMSLYITCHKKITIRSERLSWVHRTHETSLLFTARMMLSLLCQWSC